MANEVGLQPVGGDKRFVALDQCPLRALGIGDVGKGDERRAVGQRHHGIVDHGVVLSDHLVLEGFALDRERRHGPADRRPPDRVLMDRTCKADHGVNMGTFRQFSRRDFPDVGECNVEEFEAAIGAEHGDAFLQAVEGLALHVDQRVIAAFERQPLGLVGKEVCHAAVGALFGHDVDDAPVGQMPPVFKLGAGRIAGQNLGLPIAVADDGRQLALLAQAVEHGAVGRLRLQPLGVELPELAVGIVVENELLLAIEDGDRRLDAVEGAVVGRDLPFEFILHAFNRGDVDRGAG